MKVLVVHEAEIIRAGLRVLLQHCHDIALLEAADLPTGTTALHTQAADLVLIGASFFLGSELLRLRQLITTHPRISFIAYATENDFPDAQFLFALGLRGALVNTAPTLEVIAALRKIAAGERYLSQALVERTLGCAPPDEVRRLLSLREQQLMRLLCMGWRVREIASEIHLAPATVRWHRRRLFNKLKVSNEVQLLRRATQLGVISHPPLAASQGSFRLLGEADTRVL